MQTVILASVDMDCDGPTTYFYRLAMPDHLRANMSDIECANWGRDNGQIVMSDVLWDPSEWFVFPIGDFARLGGKWRIHHGVAHASIKGDAFATIRHMEREHDLR